MKPWQLGNTTVRSGLRTRDALIALDAAGSEESIRGRDGDERFRWILGQAGVVDLRLDRTNSVGRKFRSVMTQLGFLFPNVSLGPDQVRIGLTDHITPAGRRFINAESPVGQQECFLRSIVGRSIDLSSASYQSPGSFSPLRHVLRFVKEVEDRCGDSRISLSEFAIFVQTSSDADDIKNLVDRLFEYRAKRSAAPNKKRFDIDQIEIQRSADGGVVSAKTYRDYADMNLRYLRATGLFGQRGRGIAVYENRVELASQILASIVPISDPIEYWSNLTQGPKLPLDNFEIARANLIELRKTADRKNVVVNVDVPSDGTAADLQIARYELEEKIAVSDEIVFARNQAEAWLEITRYLSVLEAGRARSSGDDGDEEVVIPVGEKPAYLEWAVWRAFLAINQLRNPPHLSRRFPIDRDFLPLRNAPGGGPDLEFEFETMVLVVEVTLLTSGRQEAAEGYAVRQHVFNTKLKYGQQSEKPVYGLFIAPELDPNSLATFRNAHWEDGEREHRLDIVPMTIAQFKTLFREMFVTSSVDNEHVHAFLRRCIESRDRCQRAVEWRDSIAQHLDELISDFQR